MVRYFHNINKKDTIDLIVSSDDILPIGIKKGRIHINYMSQIVKINNLAIALFISVLLLFSPILSDANVEEYRTVENFTRLFYYQGGELGKQSFFKNYESIDIFAPQTYSFNLKGGLKGTLDIELIIFAKSKKIKIMPLVTNSGFNSKISKSILDDPNKQSVAIKSLIKEAKKNGYYGWQIDFEQMDLSLRDKFSSFVKKAGEEFRKNNLALSVAVMAHISDRPSDYPKDLWQRILGVYDYSALASDTDFVSIMAYDDPESKGPVARYSWLLKVLDYSMANIPKEKISLGIPLYYWQWKDLSGKLVGIGGNEGIQNVLKKYNAEMHYSSAEQAPHLHYKSKKVDYTLWYENAQSIGKKVSLIKENGLHGFSAWALGLELASVYGAVNK